jgi:hypothetical protein
MWRVKMKTVVIKGITGQIRPTFVARDKIEGNRHGRFNVTSSTNEDGNPIIIFFKTELLVDKALSKDEQNDVIKHERHHEADFQRLAVQLKKSLDAAYKKGGEIDLGPWLDWFAYDIDEASNAYHRRIDDIDVEMNSMPSSPRPK